MKNKKGILMPETLKIIIAVICIGFLIYLFVSLTGIATRKTDVEQARASLDQVVGVVNSLEEGEETSHTIETKEGDAWLVYFGDERLLCICLESNLKEECVPDQTKGMCEATGYVFEMLTPAGGETGVQYIKLNKLLVKVGIKKLEGKISIVKSVADEAGVWEEFASSKPEQGCPEFVEKIGQGIYGDDLKAYVSEFEKSIEELIIDLPSYWEEIKESNPYLFNQRTDGFLDGCAREFQQESEKFGMWIIFPGEVGQAASSFVLHPTSPGAPLHQWDKEDYWETTLISEEGNIIIKIYPEELFE